MGSLDNIGGKVSSLDRLHGLLKADMEFVNSMIMERMKSDVDMIPRLAGYLIAAGGKRIRPLLTLASTAIYGGNMARAHKLAAAVEFIHTATLLHDDVVDESDERRGQDSAKVVFGNEASVLVGDFLFSRSFQLMVEDGSLEVLRILSNASAVIAEGEVMQLTTCSNIDTSMEEYLSVIGAKTAALFAAACRVGAVVSDDRNTAAANVMYEYGLNLGIAFQIADDVLDYSADSKELGKNVGDDFKEGKVTAPVIIAVEEAKKAGCDDELDFWKRTISNGDVGQGDLEHAQQLIEKYSAINRGRALALSYSRNARLALAEAPDCELRAVLDDLADFVVNRRV